MTPVVALLEDLLLVGDFDAAPQLLGVLVDARPAGDGVDGAPAARDDRDRHAGRRPDDAPHRRRTWRRSTRRSSSASRRCACRSARCWSGRSPRRCRPKSAPRTRERLTAILLAFGAVGRRTVERLKSSPNPAVRRTAIYLLREFGGSEALPDLTELLDDTEPQVQREAVRAILNIGTDAAYRDPRAGARPRHRRSRATRSCSRSASVRDERATPLFAYILAPRRSPRRARRRSTCARSSRSARCSDPAAIAPLQRGAATTASGGRRAGRRRCARAAAAALARIGTPEALAVLEEARARHRAASARPRARSCARRAARPAAAQEATPMTAPRIQLADELLRRFAAALRSAQLYSTGHPIIARNLEALSAAVQLLHSLAAVDRHRPRRQRGRSSTTCRWRRPTRSARSSGGCSRAASSASPSTAASRPTSSPTFVEAVDDARRAQRRRRRGRGVPGAAAHPRRPRHRRAARRRQPRPTWRRSGGCTATPCRSAERVWDSAQTEGQPDATVARTMIDGLAQAVAQNRTALLALTTLKNYDNYTFTHMVNVSILTMGQARGARHRRPAAARVRPRRADARHRQGADAARDPEQARQADRRRVRDHEAPRRRRRRDSAADARHADARAGRRLRAPPAASTAPAIPIGVTRAVAEPRHDAVQHRRRLRRDAIAARVPAVVSDRPHPRRAQAQRRHSSSISIWCAASCS